MRQAHFELYRDRKKGWRWRIRAKNSKIVADCAESYKTRRAAMKGIALVKMCVVILDQSGNPIEGGQ